MGILRLKFLASILDEPFKQKAKKFILYLLRSNLYQNNQVDEYDINKIMMKVLVLRMASWAEYKPVLYQIKRAFQRWLHGYSLSPNLVPAIVEIGVSIGDEDDWNRVLKRYYEVDDDHSKKLCMKGLAASKNPKLLKRLLEIIMDEKQVELFFSYNKRLQNYKRLAEMEIERLRLKIRWIHRHQQQVQSWFRNICRELKL
ncbi:uncharacterized protein TRIADDRAFT_58500 [Trichoplax adhaerens]|uniref:ERAP1-like C-terminal domain-containing protein n=1 Tax=Trichoplax adhaerens TaxID=10228 RepID=B3S2W0_TRIAD|nr:hypothetical protein TRIADDRAFT_58500 [Trichoplax adhaerens]EDV22858.1 hypothetical protein TRIADDRAFT_58500 [Trichoplax adhaerens]|eukprot:XP_002114724.1 hypothetical protein TRIADDRAFT_58500 [Trichoplax adhaerens]